MQGVWTRLCSGWLFLQTDHPNTQWLKYQLVIIFHGSVGWAGLTWAVVMWAASCSCGLPGGGCNYFKAPLDLTSKMAHLHAWRLMLVVSWELSGVCWPERLCTASSCGLGFSQSGGWNPTASVVKTRSGSCPCGLQTGACQGHLPSASAETDPCAAAAADLSHAPKAVQGGEWGTLQRNWWKGSLDS